MKKWNWADIISFAGNYIIVIGTFAIAVPLAIFMIVHAIIKAL